MPPSERNPVFISGIVATIHITVDSAEYREDKRNDRVYGMAMELRQKLRHDIEEQVRIALGDEFQVAFWEIRPGSAHILVGVATAAFGIYMGFSRYKNFIESVNLLTDQIRDRVRAIFRNTSIDDGELSVRSTWTPGPSVALAGTAVRDPGPDYNKVMLVYLIATNAAMLAVLIWLVIHRFK